MLTIMLAGLAPDAPIRHVLVAVLKGAISACGIASLRTQDISVEYCDPRDQAEERGQVVRLTLDLPTRLTGAECRIANRLVYNLCGTLHLYALYRQPACLKVEVLVREPGGATQASSDVAGRGEERAITPDMLTGLN